MLEDYVAESNELMKNLAFGQPTCPMAWYKNKRGVNWSLYPKDLVTMWWEMLSADWQDYVFV